MQILKVEFENLNSLKGHWVIDFTHPDYAKAKNLFVISGPTGAGKTTILDAISLALYAKTPRQDKFNKTNNEIITRNTRSCFASVTYKCRKGIFTSRVEQSSARTGTRKDPEYSIVDEAGIDVYSGKALYIENATEAIIGLTYKQFCQSVLLAQGEFDKFLNSTDSEKAIILEKLTGLSKYREIGKRINEKHRAIEQEFKLVSTQKNNMADLILSEDTVKEFSSKIVSLDGEQKELEKQKTELQLTLDKLKTFTRAKMDLDNIKTEKLNVTQEINNIFEQLEELNSKLITEEESFKQNEIIWQEVNELDLNIINKLEIENSINEKKQHCLNDQSKINSDIDKLNLAVLELERELKTCEEYLNENRNNEDLEAVIATLQTIYTELSSELSKLNTYKLDSKTKTETHEILKQRLARLVENQEKIKAKLNSFVESNLESIVQMLQSQLSSEGICPVCGSEYNLDISENQIHNEEISHRIIVDSNNLVKEKKQNEEELSNLKIKIAEAESEIKSIIDNITELESKIRSRLTELEKEFQQYVSEKLTVVSLKKLITDLGTKSKEWQEINKRFIQGEKNLTEIQKELDGKVELKKRIDDDVKKISNEYDVCFSELNNLKEKRFELFADKNVQEEKNNCAKLINSLKKTIDDTTQKDNLQKNKFAGLEGRETELQIQISELNKTLHDIIDSTDNQVQLETQLADIDKLLSEIEAKKIDISGKLNLNEQNTKEFEVIQERYNKLADERATWETMNKWAAGNAAGDRLSLFVQGLVFENLLKLASEHLFKITNRYRLKQKGATLELEIQDTHFPNPRAVSNMSGGERFIISLSLALGISELVSQSESMDSLFLDEGFGTLSGDYLIEAINALKNLQRQGKMLGIITHVSEVIDEFDQRIEVKQVVGGHSVLVGAGITRYS